MSPVLRTAHVLPNAGRPFWRAVLVRSRLQLSMVFDTGHICARQLVLCVSLPREYHDVAFRGCTKPHVAENLQHFLLMDVLGGHLVTATR